MNRTESGQLSEPVLFFIHIPKAGGTTFNSWIIDAAGRGNRSLGKWFHRGIYFYPSGFVKEAHEDVTSLTEQIFSRSDLRVVAGHFGFGLHKGLQRPVTYATLLRDPQSRLRSLYRFHRLNQQKYGTLEGLRLAQDLSFEAFLQSPPYSEIDNGMVRRLSGVGSRREIGRCDREMLIAAKKNLETHFGAVGLSERFDASLLLIAEVLGISDIPLYYPQNVNPDNNRDVLPEGQKEVVEATNALDVELYHFGAELFERQLSNRSGSFQKDLNEFVERKREWLNSIDNASIS